VIYGTKEEDLIDEGQGGVRLAMENAIKIIGVASKKDSKEVQATDLLRYTKLASLDQSEVDSIMNEHGISVVATGKGVEKYYDPGTGTEKKVDRAPVVAAENALSAAASSSAIGNAKGLVVNVAGGDDLNAGEALDAVKLILNGLDYDVKGCGVTFNSICFNTFSEETASITVVATTKGEDGGLSGVAKSVARGEIYWYDGKWYSVTEDDLNLAIA